MSGLVLSLFPGIGLLDRAFEDEGFCVVRGPDVLWGGDVRRFHPPAGVFDGVIGGPPCQMFSRLAILNKANGYEPRFGNLIPEYERCVAAAAPRWWVMENVEAAPRPLVEGFRTWSMVWDNRWFVGERELLGAEQRRRRAVTFGTVDGRPLVPDVALFEHPALAHGRRPFAVTGRHAGRVSWAVAAGHGGQNSKQYVYSLEDACELQGLSRAFCDDMPFTKAAKLKAVANGVPLPMGRAIARAVRQAMEELAA